MIPNSTKRRTWLKVTLLVVIAVVLLAQILVAMDWLDEARDENAADAAIAVLIMMSAVVLVLIAVEFLRQSKPSTTLDNVNDVPSPMVTKAQVHSVQPVQPKPVRVAIPASPHAKRAAYTRERTKVR